jgi:hypothetical protein
MVIGKTLTERQLLGGQGINLVERLVNEMGFVWRPTSTHDVGIDGEIEVRDPASGRMAGFIMKVQSKAVSEWQGDNATTFCYYADAADIDYWQQANVPVLLIVSKPRTGEAYWLSVHDYLLSMPKGTRKFEFSKADDRLNPESRERLARLVMRQFPGFYEPAPKREETLITNLLRVSRLPSRIFLAPSEHRERGSLVKALVLKDIRFGSEWILRDKMLMSVHNLSEHPFNIVCDSGGMDHFDVKEWSNTEDEAKKRDFVQLLNRCLRERMRQLGLVFMPEKPFECYFYRPAAGTSKREFSYRGEKRQSSRKMVTVSRRKDGSIRYFKHYAFKARFYRFDFDWFLDVTPTYFFSEDGLKLYRFYEDPLKWLKEQENNNAVRGQLLTWVRLLTTKADLIAKDYPFLGFEEPRAFAFPVGLDDAAWLTLSEATSNGAAGQADEGQLGLELQ